MIRLSHQLAGVNADRVGSQGDDIRGGDHGRFLAGQTLHVNSRLLAGPYRRVLVGTHGHEFDPQAPQQIRPPRRPGSEDEASHRSRLPPRTTATRRPRLAGFTYGSASKKTASAGAP